MSIQEMFYIIVSSPSQCQKKKWPSMMPLPVSASISPASCKGTTVPFLQLFLFKSFWLHQPSRLTSSLQPASSHCFLTEHCGPPPLLAQLSVFRASSLSTHPKFCPIPHLFTKKMHHPLLKTFLTYFSFVVSP